MSFEAGRARRRVAIVVALLLAAQGCLRAHPRGEKPVFVDGSFIYEELDYMARRFPRRYAGLDDGLPAQENGHKEFAAYWVARMTQILAPFGPRVDGHVFPLQDRPLPGINVLVTVAGAARPDEFVVAGAHYDVAVRTVEGAYDNTSGCAVLLGLAKALAEHWRATGTAPSRTVIFALWDAEERPAEGGESTTGSRRFVEEFLGPWQVGRVVGYYNFDMVGLNYPARRRDTPAAGFLPLTAATSPVGKSTVYPEAATHQARFARFQGLLLAARREVFEALDMQDSVYGTGEEIFLSVPEARMAGREDHERWVDIIDDSRPISDHGPFISAGVPTAWFFGEGLRGERYPHYHRPSDTTAAMVERVAGTDGGAAGLSTGLATPAYLAAYALIGPEQAGRVPAAVRPVAYFTALPRVARRGERVWFDARGSRGAGQLRFMWSFGDGTRDQGRQVDHAYDAAGQYTVVLTVASGLFRRATMATTVYVVDLP